MNKIRCPACRGSKKVAKLGGMIGDCNTCKGTGQINECDRPIIPIVVSELPAATIIEQVAETLPITIEPAQVDSRKAIYRKKRG